MVTAPPLPVGIALRSRKRPRAPHRGDPTSTPISASTMPLSANAARGCITAPDDPGRADHAEAGPVPRRRLREEVRRAGDGGTMAVARTLVGPPVSLRTKFDEGAPHHQKWRSGCTKNTKTLKGEERDGSIDGGNGFLDARARVIRNFDSGEFFFASPRHHRPMVLYLQAFAAWWRHSSSAADGQPAIEDTRHRVSPPACPPQRTAYEIRKSASRAASTSSPPAR